MGLDALRRLYLALWPIRLDALLGRGLFPAVLRAACLGRFWTGLLDALRPGQAKDLGDVRMTAEDD
jgi:hypothetical protein